MSYKLYEILGVNINATEQEIKKVYKKLAVKYHPDKNLENKEEQNKFIEIVNAYNILSDKNKRKNYDLLGTEDINMNNPFEYFNNNFENQVKNLQKFMSSMPNINSLNNTTVFTAKVEIPNITEIFNDTNVTNLMDMLKKNIPTTFKKVQTC